MNITYTHKDILVWVKQFTLFTVFMAAGLIAFAQTPEYATYSGGVSGTGMFTCSEMPDFTYSITGDVAPGDTNVPSTGQIVDNNGGGMEIVYGQADPAQNIEVEVAGYGAGNGDGIGDAITNTVTTTINFDAPTPPGALAFMIADVEQDQVMVCALDSEGNTVPVSVIDTWFQASFDANNLEAGPIIPEWDSSTGTLVGQTTRAGDPAPGPVKQTVYVADLPDNEAGAAWFEVNIAITQLQFKSQALGVNPDDPSQHFFIATKCEEPTCADLLNDPAICDYIIDHPNTAIAQADCDNGGISNLIECQTGEDPSDPSDDCMALMDAGLDICTILAADPTNGLATQDCDNGGVDNLTECNDNKDPKDPTDDIPLNPCEAPIGCNPVPTLDVCADGTTRTIGCESGLENANVVWYNGMGVQVATGCDLVIDNTMIQNGNVGDMMCFYYIAEDPANPGCPITSCCPIIAQVIDCGFYDLALIKEEESSEPYFPGDDVTFKITVCNQGTIDAANVEITDLIPSGMTLSASDGNGWVGPAGGPVTNVIGSLPVATCEELLIDLTIASNFAGTSLINNAIITADDGDDIDSDPDVLDMIDDVDDDNDLTETDGGDDEDPEEIAVSQIYDLALIKETPSAGPFNIFDEVPYTITVCNQGTLDAFNVEVTDYIPAGMRLAPSDQNGWSGPVGGPVTNTIASITAGTCETIDIVLRIRLNFTGTTLVNFAEISADDGNDIDSTPDAMNGNDAGGAPETPSDDVLTGDGTGTPGDAVPATDEDDHDPELINVIQIYDLALIKETAGPGPFAPGDDVPYTITVCNQGTLNAANIEVTDYIPMGMTLSTSDANGWVGPAAGPVTNTIASLADGTCTTLDIILAIDATFQGNSLVNFAEISADNGDDIDSDPDATNGNDAGGAPDTPSDDVLLGDGTGTPGDAVAATDEDDHDPESITLVQVYDLALIKTESSPGPYTPGSTVDYTISVSNQGTLDGGSITITDFIPTGMTLVPGNGWVAGAGNTATNSLVAPVAGGAPVSVDISLMIDADFMGTTLVNYAEISSDDGADIDSAPDAVNGNDAGGAPDTPSDDVLLGDGTGTPGDAIGATDEDDHDPESITIVQIYDLALIKETAAAGPFAAGDDVPYEITVCNQGTLDAANVEVTDYIPSGMTLSGADGNGWNGPAAGPVTNTVASLPAGMCTTLDIILTIDAGFMGTTLVNYAEISSDDGADIDSAPDAVNGNDAGGAPDTPSDDVLLGDGTGTPGDAVAATDEDDHDPESITLVQVYDLALIKETAAAGPFAAGDDVPYTITVCNQGTLDAANVEVTDYIPMGMTLSGADGNGWNGPAAGPVTNTVASLPAGMCTTVDIILTIDAGFQGTSLVNYAEISSDDGADIDSAPDSVNGNDAGGAPDTPSDDVLIGDGTGTPGDAVAATDEDDHDPEEITLVQVYDLALIKETAVVGPVSAGDDVLYTITVCNQGTLDAANVEVTDYIPMGMTLSAADGNGWNGSAAGPVTNTVASLPAGTCSMVDIILTIDAGFQGTSLVNFAEISSDDGDDIDSAPDATNGNDAGGNPDSPSDDVLLGDGTGTPGDSVAATDEDDHDPEVITIAQVYDLALIKEAGAAGPFAAGDDVPYTITVCNQGTLDAAVAEVTDYIPTGMTLSGADANGWNGPAAGPVTNTVTNLAAGACTSLDIILTIDADFMGATLVNYAEISTDDGDDIDSTPDPVNGNDAGGAPDTPSDDVLLGDGTGAPGDVDPVTDEDDHDPESIALVQTYDLALIKEESSMGPYSAGDDVTYEITVCNQGTLDAANIEVTDYIPADMTLSTNDGNGWSGPAAGPVTNIVASLPAGMCTTIDIELTIDPGFQGTSIVNFAEISADDGDDIDSTPDPFNGNDAGGAPDTPSDDVLTGDGTGAPGDPIAATDEDDHDPEEITLVQEYDLALIKTESSSGPYFPGDDVTYEIMVCNQGTLDAASIEVTDYIPADMTLSASDGNGWAGPAAGPVTNNVVSLAAGACTTLDIVLTIDAGFAGGTIVNFAEISSDDGDDIDSAPDATNGNDAGGAPDTPSDDVLLGDGTGAPGDPVGATDEDDHDPESIVVEEVYDLALIKQVSSAGPFLPGDDVTYTITVTNQGTATANVFQITDYIPANMTLSASDANGWAGPSAGPVTNSVIQTLAPGASTTVDIVLTIDPAFAGGPLVNFAEISFDDGDDIDSTPDPVNGNDAGGNPDSASDDVNMGDGSGVPGDSVAATDEDDHDPEQIMVEMIYDLALIKEVSSAGPYMPGDDVTYTITVENQGTLPANIFQITDYIPTGMTLSANDNNGWAGPGAGPVTTNVIAPLAPGASTTVDIVLTIDPTFAGGSLVNFAEISFDDGDDVDSTPDGTNGNDAGGNPNSPSDDVNMGDGTGTPGDSVAATDEDDHDPEEITVDAIYDLALIKQESSAGPYFPGDDVTYTITVCNQGTLAASNVTVTDYIPSDMALSASDGNGWSGPAAGPVTNTIASLPVGMCQTVDIVLTIDPSFSGTSIVNFAEITADDGNDVDSTPDPINGNDAGGAPDTASDDVLMGDGTGTPGDINPATDEDDHDPEQITVGQIYDLALIKEVTSAGPYSSGDDVTYTITVTNQGSLPANLFQITDYIPMGMTLSANDTNGWAGPAVGPVTLNVIGNLAPGATTTVDIVLTIDPDYTGGTLVNYAEISFDDGDDFDSTPDGINGNDAGGNPDSASDDVNMGDGTGVPGDSNPATDEDDHDPESIDACPAAEIGVIAEGSKDECLPAGGSIDRNIVHDGFVVPGGDSLVYILVDMAGNVLQVDSIPEFIISAVGDYTIHPVIYNPLDCDVYLATTVMEILNGCSCLAIDLVGVTVSVRECCLSNAGGLINGAAAGCADPGVSDATLTATSVGLNIPAGSTVGYILTTGPGSIIQAISPTPSFNVDMAGTYAIHTIVYDPLTYNLGSIAIGVDDIFSVNTAINATGACANVDLLGLDIIAETCTDDCPFDLYIPGIGVQVTPGLYEAQNDITSDGLVNVGPVEYSAGNSVELLPGFEVTPGTEFHAYIEGCTN